MKNNSINLKEESIYKLFIKIAVPSSIGTIFQNLYAIVDSIFAGRMISKEALASIGQVFPIYFIIIALGVGLSIGSTALIANNIGKNNKLNAGNIFSQSLILSIIIAIIVSFFGFIFSSSIIYSMNSDPILLNLSLKYIRIIFIGSIFIFILMSLNSSLSAQGDTKSYRNVLIISFIINILLNPIMISGKIFSYQLFYPLGISGIAVATILSNFFGIFYLFYKLKKTEIYKFIKFSIIPNLHIITNILKQGIPASIGMMMIAIGSYILIFFVSTFGSNAVAGYTSAGRYEQLFFLPLLGLSTAVISIVGQNYGAKQYERVLETYKKGLILGITILSIVGLLIYLTANISMNLFTTDEEVKLFGSSYLKISALMFPAFPFFFIGNATFQGLEKAIVVMYMAILRFVIFPIIIISFIIYKIDQNYNFMFYGLVFMHWSIAIFYYKFSQYRFKKILSINY